MYSFYNGPDLMMRHANEKKKGQFRVRGKKSQVMFGIAYYHSTLITIKCAQYVHFLYAWNIWIAFANKSKIQMKRLPYFKTFYAKIDKNAK